MSQIDAITLPHPNPPALTHGNAAHANAPGLPSQDGCANPQCTSPHRAGRFQFDGKAVCGSACAEALLRAVIAREQALNTAAALEQRPRVQIGRILVEQGTITEAALEQALRSQKATGAGRLGSWLKQQAHLPEEAFTAALAIQCHCPVFQLNGFKADRMAFYLPKVLIENLAAVPLRLIDNPGHLFICFEDRVDHELVKALERMHGLPVDAGLVLNSDFWQASGDLASARFPDACVALAPDLDGMIEAMAQTLERSKATEGRLVSLHGYHWLRLWKAAPGGETRVRDVVCSVSIHAPATADGQLADEMSAC